MPDRHSEHSSSKLAHSISSHEESNFLHIPSTLEIKIPYVLHFFLSKNEKNYLAQNLWSNLHIQQLLNHFNLHLDQITFTKRTTDSIPQL